MSSAMGPVALVVSSGALLAASVVAAVAAALLAAVLVRRARRRRTDLDAALVRSRDEVEALSLKLEELSEEVARSRRTAELDREYVITSLGNGEPSGALDHADRAAPPPPAANPRATRRQPVSKVLEDQLVETLARTPRRSALQSRGVELVVRAVSLGHGVRRALSPDVLDRASAEAQVARRRSRRDRRRELRDLRRVRAAGPRDQEVA